MESKNFYIENFTEFEKKLNGDAKTFLHQSRKNSILQLQEMNFPTTKNEEWKYTDVSRIVKNNFTPALIAGKSTLSNKQIEKFLFKNFDYNLLVFVNGIFNEDLSKVDELPDGAYVGSLKKLTKEKPELVTDHINKLANADNAFNALNSAYGVDGFAVIVPKGTIVEKPIQVLFLSGNEKESLLVTPKNIVIAGKSSQVSVITNFNGVNFKEYLNNVVTEVLVDENAVVNIYKVQNENDNSYHIEKLQAHQKQNSIFNHYNITFGGAIVRNDINTKLDGENIETHYYGLYMINGTQHVDNHTFVDHAKPNCMSNELYKGILDENARGVFNGKIIVRQDAQKTNAYQQNKTILLSNTATIDTKPQLEIFADDVKCSHGATVGHLDEVSEFYIRSRGVPQDLAKSMLIRAFANDVIETVKIEALKEQINHMIFEHLNKVEIENE